jgi:hypothetical protein
MSSIINITPQQLRRAADLKEKMDALETELNSILGSPAQMSDGAVVRKRRKMSRAGRARIAAAARARWAKIKAGRPSPARKPKKRMSAAAKARLAAIARARWRKAKAAGKTRL